ncbi:HNH endonuclease family protein [Pseudonocardia sp. GCM10023141]|uniref:HNH endonuclease family protein n=1 Tax=Pseudonocardia sp. GCM10023141 TaxID=3252653 RepID=UPI003622F28A
MVTHDPRRAAAAGILAALAGLTIAATTHTEPTPTPTAVTTTTTAPAGAGSARELLAALTVRVEDTGAHYNRDEWGDWTTSRGCTTREAVLIRDGQNVRTRAGCAVAAGRWVSGYDDTTITDPTAVQIDHRVPVKEANRSGSRGWTRAERARFYNDPANLVAVSGRSNTSKGDRDPGTWRPPARESWCGYATAYITTKTTYRLTIDDRESAGLVAMLNTCGGAR